MNKDKSVYLNSNTENTGKLNEGVPTGNNTLEELLANYLIDFNIEGDTVIGYINELQTFKEIVEKMKIHGFAFSVRDSDVRQKQRGRTKKLSQNPDDAESDGKLDQINHLTIFYQLKAMPIKFFGLPFTIEKTTHYQCAYGCKYYKSRAGSSKLQDENGEPKPVKKKKKVGSKKMGCLAKMTIKHITVYPEYELDVESDWRKKKKLIENLRRDLSDVNKTVECFQRFYLSVSIQSSHNHPPIIIIPKMKIPKPRTNRDLVKTSKSKKPIHIEHEPPPESDPSEMNEADWNYVELASSSLQEQEPSSEDPAPRTLNLQDENFFHTLVKFPNAPAVFEPVEYKPVEIEIDMNPYESTEGAQTIEVYEYQPTIQDLQALFREKLKRLYTLCAGSSNGPLLLKLTGDLEQVEIQLSNDVGYGTLS